MAEPAGFREFVQARTRALLRTAYLLTGDEVLAQDLLQEALARTWPRWDQIGDGAQEAYVRTVMLHLQGAWWRRRWRGEVPTQTLPERRRGSDPLAGSGGASSGDDAGPGGASGVPDGGLDVELARALLTLPVGQRQVVVLRYAEDRSVQDCARLLGCSDGTVKSQASKGLAALRRILGAGAGADAGAGPGADPSTGDGVGEGVRRASRGSTGEVSA
ncbi:MAG: SigE family RNA polymerase sigma factor [Austwickia sp.]|jgi:RNA polymerase sigma factor (sigma-70 family)|nr:MAG: SigE family RNA polymerase sigma factor [Austwickia sp.]